MTKWQPLCSFRLSGATYNAVTVNFDTLPKDLTAFVADA